MSPNVKYQGEIENISGSSINIAGRDIQFQRVVTSVTEEEESLENSRKKLLEEIEQYFDIVAETLHDNPELQEEMLNQLQELKEEIRVPRTDKPLSYLLSEVQFGLRRIHVTIAKEQEIQAGEKRLQWIIPALIIVYIIVIVSIIVFGGISWTDTTEIPVIGVPVSVLLWSAIGSLAAILYRFYTRDRGRIKYEIRWLIARPIIGIIMGSLAYLAIVSGLFIFGNAVGSDTTGTPRPQLLWLMAFLGGFSDKFFNSLIDTVSEKVTGDKGRDSTETGNTSKAEKAG